MDHDLTRAVLAAFERVGVQYVIFGGVALNLQGLARATEDLDVFVAPTREATRVSMAISNRSGSTSTAWKCPSSRLPRCIG